MHRQPTHRRSVHRIFIYSYFRIEILGTSDQYKCLLILETELCVELLLFGIIIGIIFIV